MLISITQGKNTKDTEYPSNHLNVICFHRGYNWKISTKPLPLLAVEITIISHYSQNRLFLKLDNFKDTILWNVVEEKIGVIDNKDSGYEMNFQGLQHLGYQVI